MNPDHQEKYNVQMARRERLGRCSEAVSRVLLCV